MAGAFNHLELPFVPEDFVKKARHGGGGYKTLGRNKIEFYQEEVIALDGIKLNHKANKDRYSEFINPNLIFKIEVNQSIYEEAFRQELGRMNIDVISAAPDKKGYWIVFSEDEELNEFKRKLQVYSTSNSYGFFFAIGNLSPIPPEDKIGKSLQEEPFNDEVSFLDIEIWRMETVHLMEFLKGLDDLVQNSGGSIIDSLVTRSFCILRIKVTRQIYDAILDLAEVAYVERPPKIKLESSLANDLRDLTIGDEPPENSTGILVVDSGVASSHPLLENAVGDQIDLTERSSAIIDDVGHGTQVAGIALYGDIKECIESSFNKEIWIFSAKVMFKDENGQPTYNENRLLESQLRDSVKIILSKYPNCRVINLSLGNAAKRMYRERRLFGLAALIDELYLEHNAIFVVSAGNIDADDCDIDNYPNYLLNETSDKFKIIDSASSALAITVGAICDLKSSRFQESTNEYPSPITRVGPGYKGAIKPELVEYGGIGLHGDEGFSKELDIVTINPFWIAEGRLFTMAHGTSFSAPKISHYIAKLINKYPNASRNLIKALIISSAEIPDLKPRPLSQIDIMGSDSELIDILKIYGYGIPNYKKAISSESNRVLLLKENKIKLKRFHVYSFYLPAEFIEVSGERSISVTLVYDPPLNNNRSDYFGLTLEAHLFKNISTNELVDAYRSVNIEQITEDIVPVRARRHEVILHPGISLRKKGIHQKGIKVFKRKPDIDANKPLHLVIFNQNHWIKDEEFSQDYAIIVTLHHSVDIELYNKLQLRNMERVQIIQRA